MINVYGLPVNSTKWIKLFTWTRDADSGMDRAQAEAKRYGYKFAAYTAHDLPMANVFTDDEIEEQGGMAEVCK